MTSRWHYTAQLQSLITGAAIISAGGFVQVNIAGSPSKQAITDKDGAALSNPLSLTRGHMDFYAADVDSVDLYIMAPGGEFLIQASVIPSGPSGFSVNTQSRMQMAKIPFSIADCVAATEKDTGFDFPAKAMVLSRLSGLGLDVITLEAAKTIDVGTLESGGAGGGDANGLIAASSLAAATLVIGTAGALYSTNAPFATDSITEKSISYTLSSGTTLAKGFILLPYELIR